MPAEPPPLSAFVGPELDSFIRERVRAARRWQADLGPNLPDAVQSAGYLAAVAWTEAFLDGETLFDFGPINPDTGWQPPKWEPFAGLPSYDDHVRRYAVAQVMALGKRRAA